MLSRLNYWCARSKTYALLLSLDFVCVSSYVGAGRNHRGTADKGPALRRPGHGDRRRRDCAYNAYVDDDGYCKLCGHCYGGLVCEYNGGRCRRCAAGWKMPFCQECAEGSYSKNGSCETCGHCYRMQNCPPSDGVCPIAQGRQLCDDGYTGPRCKEAVSSVTADCPKGKYGENCASTCGNCGGNGNGSCHDRTGACIGMCMPGYSMPLCQTECTDGFYGDCKSGCGRCEGGGLCDKATGHCAACVSGYKAPLCQECQIKGICGLEKRKQKTASSATSLFVIISFLAALLVCSAKIVVTLIKRRKKKRNQELPGLQDRLNMPPEMQGNAPAHLHSSHPELQLPPESSSSAAPSYIDDDSTTEDYGSEEVSGMSEQVSGMSEPSVTTTDINK